jgi:hypothetical protein
VEEALAMIYDISHPHDLRNVLKKISISTEEIDALLADTDTDTEIKHRLLVDLKQQGYEPTSGGDA